MIIKQWVARLVVRPAWLHVLAAALAVLVMGLLLAAWGPHIAQWDERLTSRTWTLADADATERRLVVVDIDEKSVQALGPWPWPRERVAALMTRLDDHGVKLKVADILFDGAQPQDTRLTAALGAAPSVIAQLFALDATPEVRSGQVAGALSGACPAQSTTAMGHMAPAASLSGASQGVGHITPIVDSDGAVRRVPGIVCYQGRAYPALAVAALSAATQAAPVIRPASGLGQAGQLIDIGGIQLPVDSQGQIRVSYQMPRAGFVSIPAVDVLQGRAPAELLAGAWVLLGSTAMGAGDAVPTPHSGAAGGVEVHAQIISAALDGRTPYVPLWAPAWPWLAGGASLLLLMLTLRLSGSKAGVAMPLAALGAVALIFGAHAWLLLAQHQWLGWGQPAIFVALAATVLTAAEMLRVRFERERLYHNLASYLPEGAARRVAFAGPTAQVVAEQRDATVMFVDLRNFSAYCENHSPEDAATVLHLFYTTLERLVTERGGVVEQMVGDGLMAVWNGSTPCADHATRAVAAAEDLWRAGVAQLPQHASRNAPPLDIGIGIETGPVLVGSFGPAQRRVHTVMGEAVGVAARLEKLTAELGYPVLLGPRASAQSGQAGLQKLGDFLLAGMNKPRTLHALPIQLDASHLHLVYSLEQDVGAAG